MNADEYITSLTEATKQYKIVAVYDNDSRFFRSFCLDTGRKTLYFQPVYQYCPYSRTTGGPEHYSRLDRIPYTLQVFQRRTFEN